jgi:hypothetical protein
MVPSVPIMVVKYNKLGANAKPARFSFNTILDFGGLAIMTDFSALDPWLCVAGFRRLCLFGSFITIAYHFLGSIAHNLQNCLHKNGDITGLPFRSW